VRRRLNEEIPVSQTATRAEAPTPERRAAQHGGDQPARFRLHGAGPWRWARLYGLSTGGLCLRVCGGLRPGRRLTVEFLGAAADRRALVAEVVHSTERGDGSCLVGCRLATPLTETEILCLVSCRQAAPSAVGAERFVDEPVAPASP
jgi:hypothetical protein